MENLQWAIGWYETERGKGQTFSHTEYYPSKETAEKAIKEYWSTFTEAHTPDWYLIPSNPERCKL